MKRKTGLNDCVFRGPFEQIVSSTWCNHRVPKKEKRNSATLQTCSVRFILARKAQNIILEHREKLRRSSADPPERSSSDFAYVRFREAEETTIRNQACARFLKK